MVEFKQRSAGLSVLVAWGDLSADELLEAYCAFLDSGPTPLALVDLSSASLAEIDAAGSRPSSSATLTTSRSNVQTVRISPSVMAAVMFGAGLFDRSFADATVDA